GLVEAAGRLVEDGEVALGPRPLPAVAGPSRVGLRELLQDAGGLTIRRHGLGAATGVGQEEAQVIQGASQLPTQLGPTARARDQLPLEAQRSAVGPLLLRAAALKPRPQGPQVVEALGNRILPTRVAGQLPSQPLAELKARAQLDLGLPEAVVR